MSDTPFQAPSPEYLAGLLPQYDIEWFIAQGGMGAVYKGRQISLDRDVAIKILPREMGEDPEFRESFESEAKAMARLNHPNLLGVFDFGNAGGMPYIAMEYVHGKSLHDSAWNQAIDPTQAVAIVKGICDGLAHAHSNGIVHRDIKPSNILLTQLAVPKIGDFGLAHAADSDKPGLVMGTPGYTAPEVFRDPNQAGPLADIYAVGVILHQLLTGIDPAGNMEPPTQVTGNPSLDAIWRKATQINPALRYPNIAAMATDLDHQSPSKSAPKSASQSNVPAQPRRAPTVQRGKPARAKKSSDSGVLLKLVIICILAAVGFFIYRQLQDQKSNAGAGLVGINGTKPVEPPLPEPASVPTKHREPDPIYNPNPVETDTRDKPFSPPVVDTQPEKKPALDLPPGDPDLRERAIGLIADSRKKRDKELADNVRSLQSDLAARIRSAKADEAKLIERFQKEITGNRLPIIDDVENFGDRLAASLRQLSAKQESIDANHRTDLTRIRDAVGGGAEGLNHQGHVPGRHGIRRGDGHLDLGEGVTVRFDRRRGVQNVVRQEAAGLQGLEAERLDAARGPLGGDAAGFRQRSTTQEKAWHGLLRRHRDLFL